MQISWFPLPGKRRSHDNQFVPHQLGRRPHVRLQVGIWCVCSLWSYGAFYRHTLRVLVT